MGEFHHKRRLHVLRELGPAHLVGVGKLRLAQLSESKTFIEVCVTVDRVYGNCSSTQPAICVWRTHHLHRRERGGGEGRAALSDKCRSTCGSGYGSELTRRGGGDHGQRLKRVWGAKHYNEAPIAPKLHKRLDRCRAVYEASI